MKFSLSGWVTGRETGGKEEEAVKRGLKRVSQICLTLGRPATGRGTRGKKMDGHFLRRGSVGRRKKGAGQSCASVASLRASEEVGVGVGSQKEEEEEGR